MKNHKNKFLLFLLVGIGVVACKKEEVNTFSGKGQVLFNSAYDRYKSMDSTTVSFGFDGPKRLDTTINIVVRTQGFVANTDREFDLKILDESTAVEGTHYSIPKTLKILKDSIRGNIPLTIYRTPDMKTNIFSLKMKLIPNKNFNTDFFKKQKRIPDTRELSYSEFEIQITDQLLRPANWNSFIVSYLGTFSIKKLFLYAKVSGVSPKDWFSRNLGSAVSRAIIFKNYLLEQKDKETPVLEEDGTEMKVGKALL